MWIITPLGFVSVVEHKDDPSRVLVRARCRQDLERMLAQIPFPASAVDETLDADYPYRVEMSRGLWRRMLLAIGEVDYPNFKAAVAERQGQARARICHDVYDALVDVEKHDDGARDRGGPYGGRLSVNDAVLRAEDSGLGTCDVCGFPVIGPWELCAPCERTIAEAT